MPARTFGAEGNPAEVSAFVEHYIKRNMANAKKGMPRYTICVWGVRGIGKTDVVKQLEDREVVDYIIDLPIAQIEEMGDFHGLPIKQELGDGKVVTVTAPPSWVPSEDTEEAGVLLVDDFNRADIRIIRGIMQLLQNHRTISWALPNNCSIVLTANPEDSEYNVTSLDPAMLTRMYHITMVPEFRQWLKWAEVNDIDKRIMSFIARYQEQLAPAGAERTCPRSWAMFSNGIGDVETLKGQADLIKLHGTSVLDSVDEFISFVEGELDMVVEPEEIANRYNEAEVRDRVLKPVRERRQDVLNVMFERLCAWVANQKKIKKGGLINLNILKLLEESEVPKEMKTLYTRVLSDGPMRGMIISEKLAVQLHRVSS